MRKLLWGYPELPKAGLGNMLIPWADCLLWCQDNHVPMIYPTWAKLRLGPILRREREKRFYQRLFKRTDEVGGLQKLTLLLRSRKVSAEVWRTGSAGVETDRPTVVCFSDMNLFGNLIGRHADVCVALHRMTRSEYLPAGHNRKPFIGIHVRLGDYPTVPKDETPKMLYYRLPITWYAASLAEVRRALGADIEAIVFSDGTDLELAPLLSMSGVSRSPFREAITDLLALTEASAVITSRSTFSLWGSYLGQVPSVWYPKKSDICGEGVIGGKRTEDLEVEWMPGGTLPRGFASAVLDRVRRRVET